MPKFKNSIATFLVLFKQCVLIYSNFGLAIKKIDSLQKKKFTRIVEENKITYNLSSKYK